MQIRTFVRIMFENLFVNNALCKSIISLVNFCNEQNNFYKKELKFLKKMPLTKMESNNTYQNKFIFKSSHKTGVDLR